MNDETSCGRLECTYIPSGGAAEQAAERKYHNISDIERLRIESRPSWGHRVLPLLVATPLRQCRIGEPINQASLCMS